MTATTGTASATSLANVAMGGTGGPPRIQLRRSPTTIPAIKAPASHMPICSSKNPEKSRGATIATKALPIAPPVATVR